TIIRNVEVSIMLKKFKLIMLCLAFAFSLYGCQDGKATSNTDSKQEHTEELHKRLDFMTAHVGKSLEEIETILNEHLTQSPEIQNVYIDSNDTRYSFSNGRFTVLGYIYTDLEQGLQDTLCIYDYINESVGEERFDNVLETQKTLRDIHSLDDLRSLNPRSDGAYNSASNWFYESEGIEWESPYPNNELAQRVFEANEKKPVLGLEVRLYEDEFKLWLGFAAVPKLD
ncbi:MAG: hypothetical protein Q4D90_09980, partial [bacterium]|nr:hypothetical protein [bacterium]